jgi:hypothetical protein
VAVDAGTPEDDERTAVLQPRAHRERRRVGEWPTLGTTDVHVMAASSFAKTEPHRAAGETIETSPRSSARRRPAWRLAEIALLGLLGILAGGGTVIVAKAWLSDGGTAEPRDARAAEQQDPAGGDRGPAR